MGGDVRMFCICQFSSFSILLIFQGMKQYAHLLHLSFLQVRFMHVLELCKELVECGLIPCNDPTLPALVVEHSAIEFRPSVEGYGFRPIAASITTKII